MSVLRWLLGERAPLIRVHVLVRGRILAEGDQLYLLSPLAGG